ncbi:MAG: hypothetical protein JWN97_2115 [Nocardioides sp.]|nr:hypothetical protein [Nocardioides sp.]
MSVDLVVPAWLTASQRASLAALVERNDAAHGGGATC